LSKFESVTISGWDTNNSFVSSIAPHFPHLGPPWIFARGILLRVPHAVHRKKTDSPAFFPGGSISRGVPHLPHFAVPLIFSGGTLFFTPHFEHRTTVCAFFSILFVLQHSYKTQKKVVFHLKYSLFRKKSIHIGDLVILSLIFIRFRLNTPQLTAGEFMCAWHGTLAELLVSSRKS
jgi:hypothetical protein